MRAGWFGRREVWELARQSRRKAGSGAEGVLRAAPLSQPVVSHTHKAGGQNVSEEAIEGGIGCEPDHSPAACIAVLVAEFEPAIVHVAEKARLAQSGLLHVRAR